MKDTLNTPLKHIIFQLTGFEFIEVDGEWYVRDASKENTYEFYKRIGKLGK